ncbi:response regulator [Oxalobacteraceae bacterium OM1]|nr:response regulator [Oxalobacteraceae bacterium OM1]
MSKPHIRVLIVEDDVVDRLACRRAFSKDPDCEFTLLEAETGREGLDIARTQQPDCVLLDYNLPDLNGLEFLSELASDTGEVPLPVMLLTGAESAAVAAAAMKRGAWDYLGKDVDRHYLELLPSAIQRMLRERQLAEGKRQAEAKFRSLVEQIEAITYVVSLGAAPALTYISPQVRLLGFTPEEWLADPGLHAHQIHPDDRARALSAIAESRAGGKPLRLEYRLMTRDGGVLWFRDEAKAVTDEHGRSLFMQGILVDITQDKLAEEALRKSQAELRRLAAHLENIKEAERKRIAQEIHDELGGLLTGIKANLSVYLDRAARAGTQPDQLVADAAKLADSGFQSVRRVITDLRPSVLDQLGVWAALEWYAGQIEKRSGLQCLCDIDPQTADMELDPDISTMLFRVVQEALTNVMRHAEARHVSIRASHEDGVLTVSVQDDGKGIDAARQLNRESWGIVGMHERARYFGGELAINGSAGRGTAVVLRLPLENRHAE